MPSNLRDLHDYIFKVSKDGGLSIPQCNYAVGWIFFDLFERAQHEESRGASLLSSDFDRFAKELAPAKIERDIYEAQQEFGRAAAEFMAPEIEKRIKTAIEGSIVAIVRANTAGIKPFAINVTAGVVAGVIFAAITVSCYFFVKIDPSISAIAKAELSGHSRPY